MKTKKDADDLRSTGLFCFRCGATLSPYFVHGKCEVEDVQKQHT